MAEDWFGVTREDDRLQMLALVAQRVFPTTLSGFYRADKLTRQIAHELLGFQLPDADAGKRQEIVDRLVGGYHAHDYILSRKELSELGLRVRIASPEEEMLSWELLQACYAQIGQDPEHEELEVSGLIVARGFFARAVHRRTEGHPGWVWKMDAYDGG